MERGSERGQRGEGSERGLTCSEVSGEDNTLFPAIDRARDESGIVGAHSGRVHYVWTGSLPSSTLERKRSPIIARKGMANFTELFLLFMPIYQKKIS